MKVLELSQMEVIQGSGFWDGFCATTGIVGSAAIGLGVIGIGCGIAALT